jgi:hypothetical protein
MPMKYSSTEVCHVLAAIVYLGLAFGLDKPLAYQLLASVYLLAFACCHLLNIK